MEAAFQGTSLIRWLQQFSPTMDWPFRGITLLGSEAFFVLFLPLLYWCVNRRVGAGLAVLFLLSASLNAVFKSLFGMPRPFMVDSSVVQLTPADGNGFPSGHTQGAVVAWIYLMARFRKLWLRWLAGTLLVLIPLSRLYLGVHFPVDLAGGYLIGGVLVWGFLRAEDPVALRLASFRPHTLLGMWLVVAMVAVCLVCNRDPYVIAALGALTGTGLGLCLMRNRIGYSMDDHSTSRWGRYLIGITGLLAIYIGLKQVWSNLEPAWLFRFFRYGLLGLWNFAGAPWVFSILENKKPAH